MTAQPWMILRVTPRQERFVVGALAEHNIAAYSPLHITEAKFARRIQTRARALLPGYVFALLEDDEDLDQARAIRGVREVMCRDAKPIRVRALHIGAMVLADAYHAFDETWVPRKKAKARRYKAGDRVKIVSGHLADRAALVLRAKNGNRLDVLLTIFGRDIEVEMGVHQLIAEPEVPQDVALGRAA